MGQATSPAVLRYTRIMKNKMLALALSLATLSACGPSKVTKSTDLSSRGGETPVPAPNYRMAECNRIEIPSPAITGQISTYYNVGTLVPTYLNMNLTSVPAEIATSNTHYIQLYRWYERTAGQPVVNSTPVTMYFVQKNTGLVSNPNGSTKISKQILEQIINEKKLSTSGVTVANFFQRHFVVLTGMDLVYDAVKFAYYNSAVGANAIASGDVLLPAFYSNPNVYIGANPIPSLYTLHPNYNYRTSGLTENDYFAMIEQICAGFFGRVPASINIPEPGFWSSLWASVRSFLNNLFGL